MRPVYTVPQRIEAHHVMRFMAARGTRAVVVVRDLHPVGIVTADDLAERITGSGLARTSQTVEDAMSSPVVTIGEWATVNETIALMHKREISHLPIVRANGDLVALLTLEEALRLRSQGATLLNDVVRASVLIPMTVRNRWKRVRHAARHWILRNRFWFLVALGLAVVGTIAALYFSLVWTGFSTYQPQDYEPKDLPRQQYQEQKEQSKPAEPGSPAR